MIYNIFTSRPITQTTITNFLQQFAQLMQADMPLINALEYLKQIYQNNKLSKILIIIINNIKQGQNLAQSLEKHPKYFPQSLTLPLHLAQETGNLANQLSSLATSFEKKRLLRRKVIKSVTYPCLMLASAIILLITLMIFVIPTFINLFEQLKTPMPKCTQMLISISQFISEDINLILLISLSLWLIIKIKYKNNYKFKLLIWRFLLKTPYFGSIIQDQLMTLLAENLVNTLTAGMPLIPALTLSAKAVNNPVLSVKINLCIQQIQQGLNLNTAFEKQNFPKFITQMILIGEQTGQLSNMLAKASIYHEQNLINFSEQIQQLLEPALTLIISGIIGFVIIAMYLPIFQIGNVI